MNYSVLQIQIIQTCGRAKNRKLFSQDEKQNETKFSSFLSSLEKKCIVMIAAQPYLLHRLIQIDYKH
jgi:hypothetical protein